MRGSIGAAPAMRGSIGAAPVTRSIGAAPVTRSIGAAPAMRGSIGAAPVTRSIGPRLFVQLVLRVSVARDDRPDGAASDEVERVVDHHIHAVLGGLQLEDRSLGRRQIDGL